MKKIQLLLVCALFFTFYSQLWARKVNVENAERVVMHHVKMQRQVWDSAQIQLKHTAFKRHKHGQLSSQTVTDTVCYYVFGIKNNGFVIVSGDDAAMPVLGYSDNGNYDPNNLAPAFTYWMNCLQAQITYAIDNKLPQSEIVQQAWGNYLDVNGDPAQSSWVADSIIIQPLVQTTWNQTPPYNNLCPTVVNSPNSNDLAYTGCVATAMAQIMKFYNYPTQGQGQSSPYTTNAPSSITIPAVNFSTTTYDWANMLDSYIGGETSQQQNAVATLMYQCGASVQMDYQQNESSALTPNAAQALVNYFNYDASILLKYRKYYADTAWTAMLRQQLDQHHPILYAGTDASNGGHAFVCDGYGVHNYFHFNWGWGGYQNGYYLTSALNPGTGGAGSGTGVYSDNQNIIINIIPNNGGAPSPADMRVYQNMSSTDSLVNIYESFTVTTSLINMGLSPYSGNLGIALVNSNDSILNVIGILSVPISGLPVNAYYNSLSINCTVPAGIAPGTYKLMTVVQPSGGVWNVITGAIGMIDSLNIVVNNVTPDLSDLKLYNGTDPAFVLTSNTIQQGDMLKVEFGLYNGGSGSFTGNISLGLYSGGSLVELIGQQVLTVPNDGFYHIFTFTTPQITAPCGNYTLALYQTNAANVTTLTNSYSSAYLNNMPVTVSGSCDVLTQTTNITDNSLVSQTYPNPVRQGENLNIILSKKWSGGMLYIYDTTGLLKQEETVSASTTYSVNTSNLSSGIWLFHFIGKDGNQQVMKIVVK